MQGNFIFWLSCCRVGAELQPHLRKQPRRDACIPLREVAIHLTGGAAFDQRDALNTLPSLMWQLSWCLWHACPITCGHHTWCTQVIRTAALAWTHVCQVLALPKPCIFSPMLLASSSLHPGRRKNGVPAGGHQDACQTLNVRSDVK